MNPPTWQAFWPRRNIRPSRLPRGHQFHLTSHAGRSVFLVSTPSSPSLTVFSQALLPTHPTATSTFFLLIPHSPVVVLPPSFTCSSNPRYWRPVLRELPPTPVLPPGHFSTATASNLMRKRASSAEALTYADLPCTNNSAMNETSNQAMQPTGLRRADVPSRYEAGKPLAHMRVRYSTYAQILTNPNAEKLRAYRLGEWILVNQSNLYQH